MELSTLRSGCSVMEMVEISPRTKFMQLFRGLMEGLRIEELSSRTSKDGRQFSAGARKLRCTIAVLSESQVFIRCEMSV